MRRRARFGACRSMWRGPASRRRCCRSRRSRPPSRRCWGRSMTEPELDYLRAFLKARSGLALGPEKRYLVDSRLGPLCKRNALRDLSELVSRLKLGGDRALERLVVDAM